MLASVMILANRGLAIGGIVVAAVLFVQFVMHLVWDRDHRRVTRGDDPHDSIATKLRRFRECRDVRCGHEDCQAWNTRRARYCRLCGAPLK